VPNDELLQFYAGSGTDDRGRTLDDIWGFSREDLERVHDYIQWLFPLAEPSAFNPGAPLVDGETAARFRADAELRRRLECSLDVMLRFYFDDAAREWLTPHNHNFLRLTRILKSLTLLGAPDRAEELFLRLEEIHREHPSIIGARTLEYWRAAVKR
jgi:opioid growth factor receptor-like protein